MFVLFDKTKAQTNSGNGCEDFAVLFIVVVVASSSPLAAKSKLIYSGSFARKRYIGKGEGRNMYRNIRVHAFSF